MRELSPESKVKLKSLLVGVPENDRDDFIIRAIASDFYLYLDANLCILDKDTGQIIPFVLNWGQKKLVDLVIQDLIDGVPVRYIILKARQMGISTVVEALCYWWTATHQNIRSVIVTHERAASTHIYEMFRRYYENSRSAFKPMIRYNTKQDLVFDAPQEDKDYAIDNGLPVPGLGSKILTIIAKDDSGRSGTNHFLHGCLHEDSLVVLSDGSSKPIKDIELGDTVYTSSGAIAPVSFKTMTGEKMTYKVNVWMSNEPIIASKDHKILTDSGYKKVEDLTSDDWIAKPKYRFEHRDYWRFKWEVSRNQNGGTYSGGDINFKLDYNFGYMVGYYLAEGHINKDLNKVTFTYEANEKYVDSIAKFFKNKPRVTISGRRGRSEFSDSYMAKALNELCGRVENKHVPLFGNIEFYDGILRGYLDGDGSKTDSTRIRATSIHEKIARNINRIISLNNRSASLHYSGNRDRYGIKSRPVWINSWCYGDLKPHIKKYKIIDDQVFVRVKSVEEFEISETYDLEIDHPDHNFETPSGIVSNSEVAMWEEGADMVSSLFETVPDAPNTFIFLESTAKGVGSYFYLEWQKAEAGESNFKPFFLAWHDHPPYERPEDEGREPYSDREKQLIFGAEGLDGEDPWCLMNRGYDWPTIRRKIAWRRMKEKRFLHDPGKMDQEYPDNPMAAFLAAGDNAFPIPQIQAYQVIAKKQPEAPMCDVIELDGSFSAVRVPFSGLKIFKWPEKNRKYVIGGDVAEGITISSSTGKEGDYSVADVIDQETKETVAKYRGHMDPDEFGSFLYRLGMFYNKALLAVEVNNHGILTVNTLKNMFYPNMYKREAPAEEYEFDKTRTTLLGFATNRKTKPQIIANLSANIRDREITDYDRVFWTEAMAFSINDKGQYGGKKNGHDDTVMAKAIAIWIIDNISYDVQKAKEQIAKSKLKVIQRDGGTRDARFTPERRDAINASRKALREQQIRRKQERQ